MLGISKVQFFSPFRTLQSGAAQLSLLVTKIRVLALQFLFPNPIQNLTELEDRRWSISKKFDLSLDTVIELVSIGRTDNSEFRKDKVSFLERRLTDKELKGLRRFIDSFNKYELPPMRVLRVREAVLAVEQLRKTRIKSDELSLDPKYFATSPWEMKFLFESHLIYRILTLRNSFEVGKEDHQITIENGQLWILSEDGPISVKTIMNEFIQTEDHSFKDREGQVWGYFNHGFQQRDTFVELDKLNDPAYREKNVPLKSIGQLSIGERDDLREYMREKYADDPEIDAKRAVVEFVAQPEIHLKGALLDGVNSQAGTHTFFRIIYQDGTVYSSSLQWLQHEKKDSFFGNRLRTVNGVPVNFDAFETRKHNGCIVTPRPVTQETAERIVEQLNKARLKTIRYNQAGNNCVDLAHKVLKETGVDLNVSVSLHQVVWRCLPEMRDLGIPKIIYDPLSVLTRRIGAFLRYICPRAGKWIINTIGNGIVSFYFTPIVIALGGARGSPGIDPPVEDEEVNVEDWQFKATDKLMTTILIDVGELAVPHSSPMLHWQLKQGATFVAPYNGQPKMHFVPPKDKKLKDEGLRLHQKFSRLYAHSAPVA